MSLSIGPERNAILKGELIDGDACLFAGAVTTTHDLSRAPILYNFNIKSLFMAYTPDTLSYKKRKPVPDYIPTAICARYILCSYMHVYRVIYTVPLPVVSFSILHG